MISWLWPVKDNINTLEKRKFFPDPDNNNYVTVRTSARGEMRITGLKIGGQCTEITLSDSAWTKLERSAATTPTGSGPLENRNAINIQNQDAAIEIKIGYDPSSGYIGPVVDPVNGERQYAITGDIDLYARSASGTPTIMFEELA